MDKTFNILDIDPKVVVYVAFYMITDDSINITEVPLRAAEESLATRISEAEKNPHVKVISRKKTETSSEVVLEHNDIKYRIGYCPISIPPEYYSDQE